MFAGSRPRRYSLTGPGEGDEEGVPLRVDLLAFVACEDLAQDGALIRQQPGRALDVGEEEGDCANGQLILLVCELSFSFQLESPFSNQPL